MKSTAAFQLISFFAYLLLQVLVLHNVVLFDVAFCFLYIAFLLCLPVDLAVITGLFIGFITGLFVDIFYDTMGMHAAACVFIMFNRTRWLNVITPQGGYETNSTPIIPNYGLQWTIGYMLPIIFLHHLALFFIEAWSFSLFWFVITKVIMSTIFTAIAFIISQYLFFNIKR